MWPNPQFPVDFVTFTEEVGNGKHHFLCSVSTIYTISVTGNVQQFNLFASLSDIIVCYYHRKLLNYYYLMSLRYENERKAKLSLLNPILFVLSLSPYATCHGTSSPVLSVLSCLIFHCIKMKFSINDFFSKCGQIRRKLRI